MRVLDFITTAAAVGVFGYFVWKVILPKLGELELPYWQPPPQQEQTPQLPSTPSPPTPTIPDTQTKKPKEEEIEDEQLPTTNNTLPPTSSMTGGGVTDSNGVKWLMARGPISVVAQTRNEATDKRWSKNYNGYGVGYEATVYATVSGVASGNHIGLKHWGPNHKEPCGYKTKCKGFAGPGGMCCCCWYDSGIKDGKAYLEIEEPHNDNFTKPCPTCFATPTGNGTHGVKWAVYPDPNGGTHLKMWIDSTGKVSNQWRLAYDIIDKGQLLSSTYKPPNEQEIEMRISDTASVKCLGGGLLVRRMS